MSVQTKADEHHERLMENIDSAINNASKIVVEEEWGWDSYSAEHLQILRDALMDLLEMRARLRG